MKNIWVGSILCFGLITSAQATTMQCLKAAKVDKPYLVTKEERKGMPSPEIKDRTILITEEPDQTRIDFSATGDQYILGPMEKFDPLKSIAYSGDLVLSKLLKNGQFMYTLMKFSKPFEDSQQQDIIEHFILFRCKNIGILIQ
ncbi:hypothetical protein [Yersinia rohdei]|uniref:hypothetical protein n=1 Tax=Yersinia rohdei TaxID=29485 RepID=UPI0011A9FCE9|nr:hypothetical protein [Yersinia rohdei]